MVDDQTCRTCPMRAELIARTEAALNAKNDLHATIERLSRQLVAAEKKLKTDHKSSPLAGAVEAWLDYWHAKTSTGRGRQPDMTPGSDRWARTMKVMQRKVDQGKRHGEKEPVEWALGELKLAVDGILLSPWHMGENPDRKRYLGVDNVFKKDELTDRFIEAGRHAQAEPVEIPLRWLSVDAQQKLGTVPWLLPLLREAMEAACEWNQALERELEEFREFRSVSVLEVAQEDGSPRGEVDAVAARLAGLSERERAWLVETDALDPETMKAAQAQDGVLSLDLERVA